MAAFHCCDRVPVKNQLKVQKMYFGSSFQRFQFTVRGSLASGSGARQSFVVEGCGGASCSPHGSREAARVKGGYDGQDTVPKNPLPSTRSYLLKLPPLPILLSDCESIKHSPTDEVKTLVIHSLPQTLPLGAAALGT